MSAFKWSSAVPAGRELRDRLARKRFVCYFWPTSWWHLSLGIHVSLDNPNIEVHLPFGFIRVGWAWETRRDASVLLGDRPTIADVCIAQSVVDAIGGEIVRKGSPAAAAAREADTT